MIRFSLQDDHIGLHCGEQMERQREKMGVRRQWGESGVRKLGSTRWLPGLQVGGDGHKNLFFLELIF